jgi:hypothetical protein
MAEVKGSCARDASRRWCQSTLVAVPHLPQAGLCSGSWCQVYEPPPLAMRDALTLFGTI